jgi:folate-binding protein YgfZ
VKRSEETARLDLDATWAAMAGGVVGFELARDVLAVRGPQARTWLQGQLSQDVSSLGAGGSADALLLSPEGKMVALTRVTCIGDDDFLLDAEAGRAEAVLERLQRFRLRVKAEVGVLDWRCVALRGPAAGAAGTREEPSDGAGIVAAPWLWPGDEGLDLLGRRVEVPTGVRLGDPAAEEAARIAAGVPRWGSELDERTIPHEAGVVDRAVSFTKGCYTGQELVARLDARGARVPKRLRGVVFPPAAPGAAEVGVGLELAVGDKVVGALTSVAWSPATGGPVGLAYVRREVEPPSECSTGAGPARIVALPATEAAPRRPGLAEE